MKHRIGFNPLGRKPSHRKALHRNLVTSLFKHERIRTTKTKAQAIRRTAEKMITRAKVDSVHNRRMIARDLKDKAILAKLFVEIGPRFKERPGGYTRILKIGPRPGDAAEMVLLELVGEMVKESEAKPARGDSAKKSGAGKSAKAPAKSETKAVKAESAAPVEVADAPVEGSDDAETAVEPEGSVEGQADAASQESATADSAAQEAESEASADEEPASDAEK